MLSSLHQLMTVLLLITQHLMLHINTDWDDEHSETATHVYCSVAAPPCDHKMAADTTVHTWDFNTNNNNTDITVMLSHK